MRNNNIIVSVNMIMRVVMMMMVVLVMLMCMTNLTFLVLIRNHYRLNLLSLTEIWLMRMISLLQERLFSKTIAALFDFSTNITSINTFTV